MSSEKIFYRLDVLRRVKDVVLSWSSISTSKSSLALRGKDVVHLNGEPSECGFLSFHGRGLKGSVKTLTVEGF